MFLGINGYIGEKIKRNPTKKKIAIMKILNPVKIFDIISLLMDMNDIIFQMY